MIEHLLQNARSDAVREEFLRQPAEEYTTKHTLKLLVNSCVITICSFQLDTQWRSRRSTCQWMRSLIITVSSLLKTAFMELRNSSVMCDAECDKDRLISDAKETRGSNCLLMTCYVFLRGAHP